MLQFNIFNSCFNQYEMIHHSNRMSRVRSPDQHFGFRSLGQNSDPGFDLKANITVSRPYFSSQHRFITYWLDKDPCSGGSKGSSGGHVRGLLPQVEVLGTAPDPLYKLRFTSRTGIEYRQDGTRFPMSLPLFAASIAANTCTARRHYSLPDRALIYMMAPKKHPNRCHRL